jgi:hypothetical protein
MQGDRSKCQSPCRSCVDDRMLCVLAVCRSSIRLLSVVARVLAPSARWSAAHRCLTSAPLLTACPLSFAGEENVHALSLRRAALLGAARLPGGEAHRRRAYTTATEAAEDASIACVQHTSDSCRSARRLQIQLCTARSLTFASARHSALLYAAPCCPPSQKFNIEIFGKDLNCLRSSNWLNDETINFYIELLAERSKRNRIATSVAPSQQLRLHFFNTFFYAVSGSVDA